MRYYSIVRNVNSNDPTNCLETFRKHLAKAGIKSLRWFMVKEVSKINLQLHIHVCARVETDEDALRLIDFIEHSRFKAYVDKIKPMEDQLMVTPYLIYMCKDIPKDSKRAIDWNIHQGDMEISWTDRCKLIAKLCSPEDPVKKYIRENPLDDPFIDSEEELIKINLIQEKTFRKSK